SDAVARSAAVIERLSAVPATRDCLDLAALAALDARPDVLRKALGRARERADAELHRQFEAGVAIRDLVQGRAWVLEQLVLTAWQRLAPTEAEIELCAVGGF